jgi:hypothetical protein
MKKLSIILSSFFVVLMFLGFSVAIAQAGPCSLPDFASASFSNPLKIDNPFMPLVPGTTSIYEPVPNPDNVVNTVTVTNKTKKITVSGKTIQCRQVHDFEKDDGVLVEDTLDWYAQDDNGNVWYCGEDTTAFLYDANGKLTGTDTSGSWTAGEDVAGLGVEALPGYVMLADPASGDCYQQEYYPGEAEDEANVMNLNAAVDLSNGNSYTNCLETKEWSTLELGAIEQKFYARDVGLVLNFEHQGQILRTELISVTPPKH